MINDKYTQLVSILIPVYNREELVKKAIDSALSQTYENIEIIAVDNKSTDRTYEVLKEYDAKYKKVSVYQNEENIGPVRNWKKCLEYSSGEFIKILFSDDWIDKTFVEKCMETLSANEDVGFVYTRTYVTDGHRKWLYINDTQGRKERRYFEKECMRFPYGRVPVSPGCALFRREGLVIESSIPNCMGLKHGDTGAGIDLLIYLNSLKRYKYLYYISSTSAYFRKHEKSITIMAGDTIRKYYFTALLHYIKGNKIDYTYDLKVSILQSLALTDLIHYRQLLQLYGFEDYTIDKRDLASLIVKRLSRLARQCFSMVKVNLRKVRVGE